MATFKPVITYKRADGTYLVYIRVIHNRRKKLLSTHLYITDKDITRGGKIKTLDINEQLERIIRDMRAKCNDYGLFLKDKTVEQVIEIATSENIDNWHLDFVEYSKEYIGRLRAKNRTGNAASYEIAINNFVKFLKRDKIDINEITKDLIIAWTRYLEDNISTGWVYLGKLKAIHNSAKKEFNNEDENLIRIPRSPFNDVTMTVKVNKRKSLSDEELAKIVLWNEDGACKKKPMILARDLFLLSFYTIGTNLADFFECAPLVDDYIIYERKKTRERRKDRSEIHIKVIPEAKSILDKYTDDSGKRLLDLYKRYGDMTSLQTTLQTGFIGLRKELNIPDLIYYSARHTWATIAVNKCGVDKYTVHQALNHAEQSIKITDVYIDKDFGQINKANRKVADYCATIVQHLAST